MFKNSRARKLKTGVGLIVSAIAIAAIAQTYTPRSVQGYLWNAGTASWTAVVGSGTPVTGIYPPEPVGLYCVDGSGNWVKATTTGNCFGGGSGTINTGTTGQLAYYAANGTTLSGTAALPNGTTATTQSAHDNSTKIATTAYVDAAAGGTGFVFTNTQTTSGSASAISFTSIPGTAKDLQLTCSGALNAANLIVMQFNSDTTAANYTWWRFYSNIAGSVAVQQNIVNFLSLGAWSETSSNPQLSANGIVATIHNYANTGVNHVAYESVANSPQADQYLGDNSAGAWLATATAVTRIDLKLNSAGNFVDGTTCTLRGLP